MNLELENDEWSILLAAAEIGMNDLDGDYQDFASRSFEKLYKLLNTGSEEIRIGVSF